MTETDTDPNKFQKWILETIDSLRSRKARPDLERICRMVRRRYGSDPDQTRAELEKLIQSQTVLKVSYKGSISYRNAAKVLRRGRKISECAASRCESRKHEHLNNSENSAQSFTEPDPDEASLEPSETEVPLNCATNGECSITRLCNVAPEEQGTSALSPKEAFVQQQQRCKHPSHADRSHSISSDTTHNLVSQSQTLFIKPKLCSANSAQSERRTASCRSLSWVSEGHMKSRGLQDTSASPNHQHNSCEELRCRNEVQEVEDRDVARAWGRCGNTTLGAALELSVDGKQLREKDPIPTTREEERRQELNVQNEEDIPQCFGKSCAKSLSAASPEQSCADPEIDGTSCLLSPTASSTDSGLDEPESFSAGSLSLMDWSVSDVVSYFTAAGYSEQATAFRTQEIDGKALLFMQRNDVLTGLSIRLGPALKIYEHHVKVLQKTHFDADEL